MIRQLTVLFLILHLALFSCSKSDEVNSKHKEGEVYTLILWNGSAAVATFNYTTSLETNTTTVNVGGSNTVTVYAKAGEYITIKATVPENIFNVTGITVKDSQGVQLPVFPHSDGTGSFSFLAFDPDDAIKDPNTYKVDIAKSIAALSANKKLRLKSWQITENGQATDYYSTMPNCMKDDVFSLLPQEKRFNLDPVTFFSRLAVDFGNSICISSEISPKEINSGFYFSDSSQVFIPVYSYIDLAYNMEAFTFVQLTASDKTLTFSRTRNGNLKDLVVFEIIQ